MSDSPRDPDQDDDATTRVPSPDRPADASSSTPNPADATSFASGRAASATGGASAADSGSAGSSDSTGGTGSAGGSGGPAGSEGVTVRARPAWRLAGAGAAPGTPQARQRRRRQWFVAGISIGAALIVIALCAGALAVVDAVSDVRDTASDARETRELRDRNCLELEQRLNRLNPPGAAATPAGRAVAIRDENSAVRIYVGEISDARAQDGWRQLLDARSVYADALDRQAKARTPAFYVPPKNSANEPVADDLIESSPTPCAGPIRRLAAPDL